METKLKSHSLRFSKPNPWKLCALD